MRRLLQPTEQVLTDPSHAGLLRIMLPIRLVVRGGRKWITTGKGDQIDPPTLPNPALIKQLRRAHADLAECGLVADALIQSIRSKAPSSQAQRKRAQLAFLATDLQQAVLSGELQQIGLQQVPLSWAAQRKLLRPGSLTAG